MNNNRKGQVYGGGMTPRDWIVLASIVVIGAAFVTLFIIGWNKGWIPHI